MTARNLVMAAAGYSASTGGPGTVAITGSTTSTWNPASAPLSLATAGTYYLTPSTNIVVSSKMWGAAGGSCQDVDGNRGGAGGFSSGTITLLAGQTYTVIVGGGGAGGNINAGGGGGGFSGIFETTTVSQATAWLMAGGGGGGLGDNGAGYPGGAAGGGTSGQNGLGWRTSTTESGGQGGTQFAGGAASSGTGVPVAGSALQGGTSGSRNVAGGTPGGGGAGSNGYGYDGGGGGGGYYGGGPGASGNTSGKSFGGGGSGFVNQGKVVNGTTITGARVTPANSTDADRGTAGQPVQNGNGNPGKVVLTYVSAQGTVDTQFNNVSLLLHGDGTNGAQNNTFVDSSTNNFTITRNGNITQGTFSPYGSTWSNYFDGSSDYFSIPASSSLSLTADFTVEAWVWIDSSLVSSRPDNNKNVSIFSGAGVSGGTCVFEIYGDTSTAGLGLVVYQDGPAVSISTAASVPLNTWVHVAFVRTGTTVYGFVNGTRYTIGTTSSTLISSSSSTQIGRNVGTTYYSDFKGYISNLRVVNGSALYTANFTPPTSQLTAISGTSLLTCQSNRFVDNSINNFTLTRNGQIVVSKESPFLPTASYSASTIGGSGYFDGNGDWLQIANNTALQVSSSDFCIECWIYPTAMPASGDVARFMTKNTAWPSSFEWVFTIGSTGALAVEYYTTTTLNITSSAGLISANSGWYHIALCRSSSTISLFCNGTRIGTASISSSIASTTSPVAIGRDLESGYTRYFTGYIADARIVKGSSVYTPSSTTLTVPTSPATSITNTSLLLNFTNAGIFDNTAENTLETIGTLQINTTTKKYGTGSIYFDGSSGYLTLPLNNNFSFGAADFTLEFWMYSSGVSTAGICSFPHNSSNYGSVLVYGSSSNTLAFYSSSSGSSWDVSGGTTIGTITLNAWNHVAICRQGSSIRLFVNGTLGNTVTYSGTFTGTYVNNVIGKTVSNGYYSGYIDDFRITKGFARYTANFTPPTAAFPDQ